MLYTIGAIQIDTFPFSVDTVSRTSSADIATKPLINGLKGAEHMGEGDDILTLRGQILPAHIGGLSELEAVREHMRQGAALPVMLGDGKRLGTFMFTRLRQNDRELGPNGVGYVISHTMTLKKVPAQRETGNQVIPALLQLFDILR